MCEKYPRHDNDSEIYAKFWLIGRAYAVQLERNKRKVKIKGDFYKQVAKTVKNRFDQFLLPLKGRNLTTNEDVRIILQIHRAVMKFIRKEITEDDKRSFVSKYLHFHFRDLFFIYDSKASSVINSIISQCGYDEEKRDYKKIINDTEYDKPYADFFIKCFFLKKYLEKNGCNFSLREIDSYLLERANAE